MRPKQAPFDALEVDLEQILGTSPDARIVLVRIVIVIAAVVVGMLIFDYYVAEKSHVVQILQQRRGDEADPDRVEAVLDRAGHVRRRIVLQAPRRMQQNADWNKKRWQEALADKLVPSPPQKQ